MSEFPIFALVGAACTGAELLAPMLGSHPDIAMAGELFRGRLLDDPIPWLEASGRDDLVALRRHDPVAALRELGDLALRTGRRSFGFVMSYEDAERVPRVVDQLRARPNARVVHLTRRNRLHRFLVERHVGRAESSTPLGATQVARDFVFQARRERMMAHAFGDTPVQVVRYEDLIRDPAAVGAAVVEFLGLAGHRLRLPPAAADVPAIGAADRDALRRTFGTWLSCFED